MIDFCDLTENRFLSGNGNRHGQGGGGGVNRNDGGYGGIFMIQLELCVISTFAAWPCRRRFAVQRVPPPTDGDDTSRSSTRKRERERERAPNRDFSESVVWLVPLVVKLFHDGWPAAAVAAPCVHPQWVKGVTPLFFLFLAVFSSFCDCDTLVLYKNTLQDSAVAILFDGSVLQANNNKNGGSTYCTPFCHWRAPEK